MTEIGPPLEEPGVVIEPLEDPVPQRETPPVEDPPELVPA